MIDKLATAIQAMERKQALLETDKSSSQLCLHCHTQNIPGITAQTRWHIDCQNREIQLVDSCNSIGVSITDRTIKPGAQQGIHNDCVTCRAVVISHESRAVEPAAGHLALLGKLLSLQGITIQLIMISQLNQFRIETIIPGKTCKHIAITTVVASANEYLHMFYLGPFIQQGSKGHGGGLLHQGKAVNATLFNGDSIQLPYLGGLVKCSG